MNKLRTVFASVGAALVVPAIALAGPPVHAVSHVAAPASTQAQAKPQAMTAKAPVSTKTTGQPNQSCGSATAPNTDLLIFLIPDLPCLFTYPKRKTGQDPIVRLNIF